MASYVYNPSQKVTELLSKFLEFDSDQLDVGVWSGDLSLKNVNLKREAIQPVLNGKNNKKKDKHGQAPQQLHDLQHKEPVEAKFKKEPLNMKLVKGTVGQMRIRIPWKSLVWGQGAVQLEVSDVSIVLSFQSREETEREQRQAAEKEIDGGQQQQGRSSKVNAESSSATTDQGDRRTSSRESNSRNSTPSVSTWAPDAASNIPGITNKSYREAKQKRLREAERRQVSGLSLALWLENLNKKNSIVKDAQKIEKAHKSNGSGPSKSSAKVRKEGRLDRFLKNTGSDLFWRFFAGIQGSIKKVRIVLVQDGIEVGCIIQSIEVFAGKDGTKVTSINENSNNDDTMSDIDDSAAVGSSTRHSQSASVEGDGDRVPLHYESAYDDGEHVDKTLKQNGIGFFVRKVDTTSASKIPHELRFSSSVSADDYILRPVNIELNFSFFYPYPPERRNKNKHRSMDQESNARGTNHSVVSDSATTASSRRRRGKREKEKFSENVARPTSLASSTMRVQTVGDYETPRRGRLKRNNSSDDVDLNTNINLPAVFEEHSPPNSPHHRFPQHNPQSRHHRLLAASRADNPLSVDQHHSKHSKSMNGAFSNTMSTRPPPPSRRSSFHRTRSNRSTSLSITAHSSIDDSMSIMDSPTITQKQLLLSDQAIVPRLECRVAVEEIRIIFTTRHYELLSYFLSTVSRMKNGRPDRMIRSVKETEPGSDLRKMMSLESDLKGAGKGAVVADETAYSGGKFSTLMGLWTTSKKKDDHNDDSKEKRTRIQSPSPSDFFSVDILSRGLKSARQETVVKWWKYVIGAILWEVRKRKHMTSVFRKMYMSFDWERQRYRRQEYIETFISLKLADKNREGSSSSVWPFEDQEKKRSMQEALLLEIEDQLSLEQILLYRSIARSLGVQGLTRMPRTVLELRGRDEKTQGEVLPITMLSRVSTMLTGNVNLTLKAANHNSTEAANVSGSDSDGLLGLVQHKFEFTKRLREKGGVSERFKLATQCQHGSSDSRRGARGDDSGDYLSTEAANFHTPTRPPLSFDRQSSGMENSFHNTSLMRSHRRLLTGTPTISYSDLQAGTFYSSGGRKRDSQGDVRTIKTSRFGPQSRFGKQSPYGYGPGTAAGSTVGAQTDNRMRISFSFHIKTVDLMVVEEDYYLEISPDLIRFNNTSRLLSHSGSRGSRMSGDESSSSENDLSDLSVLTDDERYFTQEGASGAIAEVEEEADGDGANLLSEDFLLFRQPENPLLRLKVSLFTSRAKGVSGGDARFAISVGRIEMVGSNCSHILSIGEGVQKSPVAVVDVGESTTKHRRQSLGAESIGESTFGGKSDITDDSTFLRTARRHDARAISLSFSKETDVKTLRCDFSKLTASANLDPVDQLLRFYAKSEIKQPERLLPKSSRDVARKIMIQKMSSGPPPLLVGLSVAMRVHGVEVQVPCSIHESDAPEASDLRFSSHRPCPTSSNNKSSNRSSCVFVTSNILEFYSGKSVEELIQNAGGSGPDLGAAPSIISGSFRNTRRTAASTSGRKLDMLDLAELTEIHDSFASTHFVATIRGLNCGMKSASLGPLNLTKYPIDLEALLTSNDTSLLETESAKQQMVVESTPIHLILSNRRIRLLNAAVSAIEVQKLDAKRHIQKLKKPEPPRIEILSHRILNSTDLKCPNVRVDFVQDTEGDVDALPATDKELIMEECLADFLSIVSCFDFSLPNEEAMSSAMHVCIGRLVGLGLSDDEAWSCTNTARINFLDDVAMMRKSQSEVLREISSKNRNDAVEDRSKADESARSKSDGGSGGSISFALLKPEAGGVNKPEESDADSTSMAHTEFSDDDSRNSADIVETTIWNAVEKTVSTFSVLLEEDASDAVHLNDYTFLVVDLPTGLTCSLVKLFYDDHMALLFTSLVLTNKAGIEMLTLVPHVKEATASTGEEDLEYTGHGLSISTFNLDKKYGFGSGGLAMATLASNEGAESEILYRDHSKYNDVEIGELELLFSYNVYDDVIDNVVRLFNNGQDKKEYVGTSNGGHQKPPKSNEVPKAEVSNVIVASSISLLFTTDTMVPFSRLTMEYVSYKNSVALASLQMPDTPSWALVAKSFEIQNLCPEGQLYPSALSVLSLDRMMDSEFPFQLRYFKSPDPWKVNSRLEIDFTGFRLFLIRQFIHEILAYFVYDRHGVGKLKKKHSSHEVDIHGNGKPPLLITVFVYDTSVICPRNSTSSDMVAFEVDDACIAISYVPETFAMPTPTSFFDPNPPGTEVGSEKTGHLEKTSKDNGPVVSAKRSSVYSLSISDFEDCESTLSDGSTEPISTHTSNLKRRVKINLDGVKVFTAIADSHAMQDVLEGSLFRFLHEIDGRAEDGKQVYQQDEMLAENFEAEELEDFEALVHCWEEISTNPLSLEVLVDYAPHMRLLIANHDGPNPFSLDAKLSQLCLLLSVWDSNMQEMPTMFPFPMDQVSQSASPPDIPTDFPEYASEEFVSYLEKIDSVRSEICCIFHKLSLRMTYDSPGFFTKDPNCFQYMDDPYLPEDERQGLVLTFDNAVVHVLNNFLNVKRIAIGASGLELVDERRIPAFQHVLTTTPPEGIAQNKPLTWADLSWGLREDARLLSGSNSLPQPVQLTVFMTPGKFRYGRVTPGWSMINFGAQDANGTMHDLSWIWVLLEYFKSYFSIPDYGNLGLFAQRWAHRVKNAMRRAEEAETKDFVPHPGIKVDFRLWLCRPILCLPGDYNDAQAPSLCIHSDTGLWYRYKSIEDLSSQEVVSTDLNLSFLTKFKLPDIYRQQNESGNPPGRPLIEGLSFGLRYDCNNACNHKDVSIILPFDGEDLPTLSVAGEELEVVPKQLNPPVILNPYKSLSRRLGPRVCELTLVIEVLPMTSATMMNFFKGPTDLNPEFVQEEPDAGPPTFSITARVGDIRAYVLDPDLGVQLPVAVASISSVEATMTKFATASSPGLQLQKNEPRSDDMQIFVDATFWADYFKLGLTRSWEPLIEPFSCTLLQEKSARRGKGFSLQTDHSFHINLSGALLRVLNETMDSFRTLITEAFGDQAQSRQALKRSVSRLAPSKNLTGSLLEGTMNTVEGRSLSVLHERAKILKEEDRVAFSLRNLTGQRIRIHQQGDYSLAATADCLPSKPVVVSYVNQGESMGLTFAATISVVRDNRVIEVSYPGFPNSKASSRSQGSLQHAIDLQLPGCRWIHNVKVDTFGRKFEMLTPKSSTILAKIENDWRLKNIMYLLTEVGLENGGRLVTTRSLFEIQNNTGHMIKVVYHPDPNHLPERKQMDDDEDIGRNYQLLTNIHRTSTQSNEDDDRDDDSSELAIIAPGDTFQIPTILIQGALELPGNHLGSVWICPDTTDPAVQFRDFTRSKRAPVKNFKASFCARPIQLAQIVLETSFMSTESGEDIIPPEEARTGVHVSCPTKTHKDSAQAPFCYAIEVDRSPVVFRNESGKKELSTEEGEEPMKDDAAAAIESNKTESKKERKMKSFQRVHGPVAYSLSVHSPLVIVNLLPESGRFELMHAVRKTVVWFADLQPGEQTPVHSIGLDAPLLLLLNLGYCRTPVGEGALVHHGADSYFGGRGHGTGFMNIGRVVSKGTKQIGKTLTTFADSPDKRAHERLAKINTPQFYEREGRKGNVKRQPHFPQGSLGQDGGSYAPEILGGKIHSVETMTYSPADVASETTVVDSIGQRLTLNIENIRGGGGQRRVSIYCPFWIVNTTHHALRYKQEKAKSYVCGTVISPEKDGSVPVDGSEIKYRNRHIQFNHVQLTRRVIGSDGLRDQNNALGAQPMNSETIFAGTPGALATSRGRCDLSPEHLANLIDHEMPINKLAELAFMFNFNEDGLSTTNQMISVQLYNGLDKEIPISDWSSGFGLETVGISQTIGLPCKDGRVLELSASVNIAPGYLSGYTKVIRLFPRYVIFNRLERPVRLWQDSSVVRPVSEDRSSALDQMEQSKESRYWRYRAEDKHFDDKINEYEALFGRPATLDDRTFVSKNCSPTEFHSISAGTKAYRTAFYIKSLAPSELSPFHLPDSRAERQLRLDLGGEWNMSPSFPSEFPGEHVLRCTLVQDARLLKHVSTRVAPKYKIVLPPPDESGIGDWDGDLGVYFETDWGSSKERRIVVKGTRRGKYAYNHTDIHVGDELLRVDGVSVLKMTFEEVMQTIKERLAQIRSVHKKAQKAQQKAQKGPPDQKKFGPIKRLSTVRVSGKKPGKRQSNEDYEDYIRTIQLSLTFRTQEERLRKLRSKAGKVTGDERVESSNGKSLELSTITDDESNDLGLLDDADGVSVEMKSLHNTMFVILRNPDPLNPPFRIQNRSIVHIIFFRQRHCEGHGWRVLLPGESLPYSWEEPMKSKKLTMRVAVKAQEMYKMIDCQSSADESFSDVDSQSVHLEEIIPVAEERRAARTARLRQFLAYQYVNSEERGEFGPSITVRLEEIGFRGLLPIPSNETKPKSKHFLECEVDTDGGTRLLIVSDNTGPAKERNAMSRNLATLEKQISNEKERLVALHSLQYLLAKPSDENPEDKDLAYETSENVQAEAERLITLQEEARQMVEDFPEEQTVSSPHQVVVEVLEAIGLSTADIIGSCNPYCEVFYKGRSRSRKHFFQKRQNKRKTYFIENSLAPKWLDQVFVFSVSDDAVRVNRGHSVQVKIRNFRNAGQHTILGQASVHFASLRNQREICGWYPLTAKVGNNDIGTTTTHLTDVGRGSIKLRLQWIYTVPAMVDYYILMSERRLHSLVRTRDGLADQLETAVDTTGRSHETLDQLPGGRISKLVKLRKKKAGKREAHARLASSRNIKVAGTELHRNDSTYSSASELKDTLKASRDRYLYAMYFQTLESRRNRLSDLADLSSHRGEGVGAGLNDLPVIAEQQSRHPSSAASSKKNLDEFLIAEKKKISLSPRFPEGHRRRAGSLDDFLAFHRSPLSIRSGKAQTPIRTRKSLIDSDAGRQILQHRYLSLDVDEKTIDNSGGSVREDRWEPSLLQGKAVFDGTRGEIGISDLMSVHTDMDEDTKRRRHIARLLSLGYLFHDSDEMFHQNHLPNHFRHYLFTSSPDERKSIRMYQQRLYVGNSASMRYFKTWQAAQALFWDTDVDVIVRDDSYLIRFKDPQPSLKKEDERSMVSPCKKTIADCIAPPRVAPQATIDRSQYRIETMYLSRISFERACQTKTLASVLNSGGWLTVRPMAALNLPDSYSGMMVKLKYGSQVLSSATVDATISPRWTSSDFTQDEKKSKNNRRSSVSGPPVGDGRAFSENDLHIQVEPQQSSGSIRLALIAERMNNKVELGVVHIPLGAAISACIDASHDERAAIYTRWYPLVEPQMAASIEGDMGLSGRPQESEQLQDNLFQAYNCPCIRLALKWWPDEESSETRRGIHSYFSANIFGISAALVDSQRAAELLSLSLSEIDIRNSVTKARSTVGLVVRWIQIDHQGASREPVVLAPTPAIHDQPILQCFAIKDNQRSKRNIVSFQYIGVALQEMDITVEENWMYEVFHFFKDITRQRKARGQRLKDNATFHQHRNIFALAGENSCNEEKLFDIIQAVATDNHQRQKMYVETLILGEARFNVSYVKGKKTVKIDLNEPIDLSTIPGMPLESKSGNPSEVYEKWTNIEDTSDEGGNQYNLPGLIATVFPSVSDAPLRLQGKIIEHVFESQREIFSSLQNYYTSETMKQIYKIIGSLDFVGNPTVLLSSFASGVRDLVAAPTKAFKKNPTNVKKVAFGVGKGTISLFSHSASGLSGFSARLWASFGQAVATLSLDSDFRQWHRDQVVNETINLNRAWKRRGIPNARELLLRPIADVGFGLASGIAGIIISPYKGARKNGLSGFAHGCIVGITGLVAKPVVGVFDSLTHVSQNVHDIARSANVLERRHQPVLRHRLPYVFGPRGILLPYSPVAAKSVHLLSFFPLAKKLRKTKGETHVRTELLNMEPGIETYIIVTTLRVVVLKQKHTEPPTFGWQVYLTGKVSSMVQDYGHNGCALVIKQLYDKKEEEHEENNAIVTEYSQKNELERISSAINSVSGANNGTTYGTPMILEHKSLSPESFENLSWVFSSGENYSWAAHENTIDDASVKCSGKNGSFDDSYETHEGTSMLTTAESPMPANIILQKHDDDDDDDDVPLSRTMEPEKISLGVAITAAPSVPEADNSNGMNINDDTNHSWSSQFSSASAARSRRSRASRSTNTSFTTMKKSAKTTRKAAVSMTGEIEQR